ncbi:MAG: ribosomal protein S18-alanine N-acetyltransferase [Roseicyclus sp.]
MTPARMAELHAQAFAGGEIWTEAAIRALLVRPATHVVTLGDDGFAILQILPPEAELLTIAVAPARQGRGIGAELLSKTMADAAQAGADTLFLEVAADNAAARALYTRAGFARIGRRKGYFARPGAVAQDALVLSCLLHAENSGTP